MGKWKDFLKMEDCINRFNDFGYGFSSENSLNTDNFVLLNNLLWKRLGLF